MKKTILLGLVGLSAMTLAACSNGQSSKETTWDNIKKDDVLKVATPATLYPTSYYDDHKKLTGYEIDMMKAIAKKLKIKVKFVEVGVAESFTSVDSGKVDVAVNNFDTTPERLKKYNFSQPYKYSVGGMIVRADGSSKITAKDLSDWKGKKAGGGAGTQYMKIAKQQGAEPVIYDNVTNDVYLRDVSTGRTDFIPNDYYTQVIAVKYVTKQYPDIKVKMGDVKYNPTEQGIVMSKKDKSLKTKIDAAIKDMKKDGSLKKISEKYYAGQDLTKEPAGTDKIPVIKVK